MGGLAEWEAQLTAGGGEGWNDLGSKFGILCVNRRIRNREPQTRGGGGRRRVATVTALTTKRV